MPRVLVLAGNSFVGRHLCPRLVAAGHEVLATHRSPLPPSAAPRCDDGAAARSPSPLWAACDLAQPAAVEALVDDFRPQQIVHLAAATATADPALQYRLHVTATLDLLLAAARYVPEAAVVLLGSAAEYGNVPPERLPVDEDLPPRPASFFGASKLAQTELAVVAAAERSLRVAVLRPFNVLGPGLPEHYLAASLANRLRSAQARGDAGPLRVANGAATRDFVDVRDVARAIEQVAAAPLAAGRAEVYNVATGRETAVLDVARRLCELANAPSSGAAVSDRGDAAGDRRTPFWAEDAGSADSRSRVARSCGNAARLQAATGWRPSVDWRDSLAELWHAAAACGPASGPAA